MPLLGLSKLVLGAALWGLLLTPPVSASPEDDYRRGLDAYNRDELIDAMGWLEQASAAGHPKAQALLAYILDKAEENERAFALYNQSAGQGEPAGLHGLGIMYLSGDGVPQDLEHGLGLVREAAELGHGPAAMSLYNAYRSGDLGLAVDAAQARAWLERAAAAGFQPARDELARIQQETPGAAPAPSPP